MKRTWISDGAVEVGLDEAGRGSLWGRLYVGAVVMPPDDESYFDNGVVLREITDSKKLTPRRRAILKDYIQENAVASVVTWAEPSEIDEVNILQADLNAMHRALNSLWIDQEIPIERILVDGDTWRPWFPPHGNEREDEEEKEKEIPTVTIVGGDASVLAIAAASILAKEAHDEWVRDVIVEEPDLADKYGFDTNMGYGTRTHLEGLKEWGAHSLHRRSFAPVRKVIDSSSSSQKPLFRSSPKM